MNLKNCDPLKHKPTDEEWLAKLEKDYPPLAEEVKQGYKAIDLTPLKCIKCDHTEFENKNPDYLDGCGSILCEYDTVCKNCGHVNGHWAYGNYCV